MVVAFPWSCLGEGEDEDDEDEEESDDEDDDDDDEEDGDGQVGRAGGSATADAFPLRVVLAAPAPLCGGFAVPPTLAWAAASPSDLERFCDLAL